MKAIVHSQYGSPALLKIMEVDQPIPKDDEVLIRIQAASLNYGDSALVRGEPFLVRFMGYGLLKPKYPIPGTDIAGVVDTAGRNTSRFKAGDQVFGDISDCGFGAFAEYVSIPEDALASKPANLSFEEAAAVPQASVVALQVLCDEGQIQSGQHVLILPTNEPLGLEGHILPVPSTLHPYSWDLYYQSPETRR